jgi:hypothetical protein
MALGAAATADLSPYAALQRSKATKAIDAIRIALKFSDMGMKHLREMSDAPLLRPGPWGGNHAMWIPVQLISGNSFPASWAVVGSQRPCRASASLESAPKATNAEQRTMPSEA